jgi:signal transduction histidine kinase
MRLANLRRSTPFRLALVFGVLFVASFIVCGSTMYHMLRTGLAEQMDVSLEEMTSVIMSTYASDDIEDLATTLQSYATMQSTKDGLYSLMDSQGNRLAGNFAAPQLQVGIKTLTRQSLGLSGDGRYRVQVSKLGSNMLVVGESFADMDGLLKIILINLGWAATLVISAAISGGIFLAARAQARLDAVASTMLDVSNGRLDARIPLHGANDDLDIVARQINDALERLSGLVEGMRQVSADIAHELKTPLNRLKIILDTANSNAERGQDVSVELAEARNEIDYLNATFEALLRISQIEAGTRRDKFRQIDLQEIMGLVEEIYSSVADDRRQTLILNAPQVVHVLGDRELVFQMVVNLVENAITHCPEQTIITCNLATVINKTVITVEDNGLGIPREERENVFRRLYRLDKSRTTPGSGLGLSLVKAIADLHHAELSVDDCAPGLKVSVAFPRLV